MTLPSSQTLSANKGDLYCRPSNWVDVAKFFLLNYGLHALTVVLKPGSGALETTFTIVQAVHTPYTGMTRTLLPIQRLARFRGTPLQQAIWAGALCVEVPHIEDEGSSRFVHHCTHCQWVLRGMKRAEC